MKRVVLIFCLFFLIKNGYSQTGNDTSYYAETDVTLTTKTGEIFGTLCEPKQFTKIPVALIIAGSGPVDRDGNEPSGLKTDGYKLLAHQLAANNIATVRYDKRGIAKSWKAMKSEADIRFEDFINDADDWVQLLKSDTRFSKVIIIGHSEGSLIGMIAAEKNVDAFISIAGPGRPLDEILTEQLRSQPQAYKDTAARIMDSLKKGVGVQRMPMNMLMLFRPSVQPFIISLFKYNPVEEIKKLIIPVLVIQGTRDEQVSIKDAQLLSAAKPDAKLVLIKNMAHTLKKVGKSKKSNEASYSNPSLPVDKELVSAIITFINGK